MFSSLAEIQPVPEGSYHLVRHQEDNKRTVYLLDWHKITMAGG